MAGTLSGFFIRQCYEPHSISADALRVQEMNLSLGGEQNHNMRGGWNPLTETPQKIRK